MCGICGLVGPVPPDPDLVERMNAAIVHRGPDHGAVAAYGRCVLGYRRLSIIDLRTGDQPVESERGDIAAVFNGEIYNFRALRRELEAKGHEIRGTGDSPLIPHAYEEWGLDFVERLDGMFALAVWDREAERLVLARDRLGKKPLLYARLADGSTRVRVRDQGAPAAPLASPRARPRSDRRLPRPPVRPAVGPEGDREGPARVRRRGRGRHRPRRALLASPAGVRHELARGMDRARARGGAGSGAPPARLGRPPGRSTLGRDRLDASSSPRWQRPRRIPSRRSRSDSRTPATTSAHVPARSPSASARTTPSSRSTPGPSCSNGSRSPSTSRSGTRPRCRCCSSARRPAST